MGYRSMRLAFLLPWGQPPTSSEARKAMRKADGQHKPAQYMLTRKTWKWRSPGGGGGRLQGGGLCKGGGGVGWKIHDFNCVSSQCSTIPGV